MNPKSLVKMANQIAQYFSSEPDKEQAVKGVQLHLQSFWTPAMRFELMVWHVDHYGGDLHPLVRAALEETGKMA